MKKKKKNTTQDNRRFFSMLDMATIKKAQAIKNSKVKRGQIVLEGNNEIVYPLWSGQFSLIDFAS